MNGRPPVEYLEYLALPRFIDGAEIDFTPPMAEQERERINEKNPDFLDRIVHGADCRAASTTPIMTIGTAEAMGTAGDITMTGVTTETVTDTVITGNAAEPLPP
jgi:hypothetical protein